MNLITLLHGVHTLVVLGFLISYVVPLVGAGLYRLHWSPTVLGVLNTALAIATGFLTTWASAPNADHYDWKTGVLAALVDWVIATTAHTKVWSGTPIERQLLNLGSRNGAHQITTVPGNLVLAGPAAVQQPAVAAPAPAAPAAAPAPAPAPAAQPPAPPAQ